MHNPNGRKVLPVLFVTLLLDMIGTGMIIPLIPSLFTDPSSPAFLLAGHSNQYQLLMAGLVVALFGIMQFVAAPILGELSDLYGRKKLLIVGVGMLAVSQFFFGVGIEFRLLWLLLLSRAIAGIASANFSIAQASIADVTAPKDRAKNFGLMGAAFGIGFVLGPVISGWLVSATNSPVTPFWFASFLGIINLVLVSLLLPETHVIPKTKRRVSMNQGFRNLHSAFQDVDARPLYVVSFLFPAGFAFFTSFSSVYIVHRFGFTEGQVGTYFGVIGAWIVITQAFVLRILSGKYTEKQILKVTLLMLSVSIATYPLLPTAFWIYTLVPFVALPVGLSMANVAALISKSVSAEKQGAALGINGSLNAFAQGIVPLMAGLLAGTFGLSFPFFVGGLLVLIAWGTFVFSLQKR